MNALYIMGFDSFFDGIGGDFTSGFGDIGSEFTGGFSGITKGFSGIFGGLLGGGDSPNAGGTSYTEYALIAVGLIILAVIIKKLIAA